MKDKMTWEETIQYIRTKPEYSTLVKDAYFDADLNLNVDRFYNSEEFKATLQIIKTYTKQAKTILDIGSGNGIASVSFAKLGYEVTSVEPDTSTTIGANAIEQLKIKNDLNNLKIYSSYAEDLDLPENYFDIVYIRQAMHHANNLDQFIKECVRVLKPNGLLLTIRDHVIYDKEDKQRFLEAHPLHKYYGGENAFTTLEYKHAITKAGATLIKELKFFDSKINYAPLTTEAIEEIKKEQTSYLKNRLKSKIGFLANIPFIIEIIKKIKGIKTLEEKNFPGRMYSYIAIKQ